MHRDRNYLEFLQESTFKNRAFISKDADPIVEITKEEFREELHGIFESDDELDTFIEKYDVDWNAVAKHAGGTLGKIQAGAEKAGMQKGAAATAIVAAAAIAAIGVYKRFLSKAAKACAGLPTTEKTNCMRKHKATAIKAKIQKFESFKSKCDQAKNPTGCNNKLMFKIKAEKSKLGSD